MDSIELELELERLGIKKSLSDLIAKVYRMEQVIQGGFAGASIVSSSSSSGGTTLTVKEIDGSPSGQPTTLKFSNGSVTDNGDGSFTITTGAGGGGDFSSNTSTSVDSELVLFSGTAGKTGKRASGSGVAIVTSGVLSTKTNPTGAFVGDTDTQTLSSKTLTTPVIASFTNATHDHTNAAGGGALTHAAISDFDAQVRTSTLNQMTAPTADLSINSHKLTSVTDPTSAQDAATKAYVDSAIAGTDYKEASKYATTAALPTVVYSNGSSGVGATLTGAAVGALSIDSSSPSVGQRILIKDQVDQTQNGIYTVTATGSGIAVFVMTRTTDFDQSADIVDGDATYILSGTVNGGSTWVQTTTGTITLGSSNIVFSQIAGPGSILAGTGISVSGLTIAINTAVTVDKTTAQVLTNKSLSDTTSKVVNVSDNTKAAIFDLSGATTGKTATLALPITNNRTITFPDATDTLVGKATTDTLTNKTLTAPVISTISNTGTLTLPTATDTLVGRATTDTLSNKRITHRVNTVASSATPSINTDTTDLFTITALAAAITSMTTNLTGTPNNFDPLTIRILDNGTARAITWGASFASRGATLPLTTVISKYLYVGFRWNSTTSTWDCVAVSQEQ